MLRACVQVKVAYNGSVLDMETQSIHQVQQQPTEQQQQPTEQQRQPTEQQPTTATY